MYNCSICVIFMTAPSAKNQEKQRMQKDQNAMDATQYKRERSNLKREMSHYRDFLDFLNKKAMARDNQDMDLMKGYYFTVFIFNVVPADSSIFMLSYCGAASQESWHWGQGHYIFHHYYCDIPQHRDTF